METKPMSVTLTESAIAKVKNMAAEHGEDAAGIRVMIVGGGCSGLTYDMDFETVAEDGDQVFEAGEGLKVFVDPMSYSYLAGTKIDYVESFTFAGFHFLNPNAQKSCGCGSSFTV